MHPPCFRFTGRAVFAAVILALSGPAAFATDIRGQIISVSTVVTGPVVGTLRVDGTKFPDTLVDRALIRLTTSTKIQRNTNGQLVPAKVGDLQVGQTIEGTFTGPIAQANPVQAVAGEIIILADAPPSANPAAAYDPVIKDGATLTLTGNLQGGLTAVGGETTGWRLAYDTSSGSKDVELDLAPLALPKPPAPGRYVVTGNVTTRDYTERGPTLVLLASRLQPLAAGVPLVTPSDVLDAANAPLKTLPAASPAASGSPPSSGQPQVTADLANAVQKRHIAEIQKLPGLVGSTTGRGPTGDYEIILMMSDPTSADNPDIPQKLEGVNVRTIILSL